MLGTEIRILKDFYIEGASKLYILIGKNEIVSATKITAVHYFITFFSRQCCTHAHHGQICCHNTDYVHVNGHDRTITVILAKHCIKLPDEGSLVI